MNSRQLRVTLCAGALLLALGLVAAPSWAQGNTQAEKDFAFAQGLYGQDNYALAAEKFVAFIKAYANHANISLALFRAGECLFRINKYAEAEPYFQRLTRDYAASAEAEPGWVWLGDTNFQAQHFEEAVTAYGTYVQKYPQGDQAGRAAYWLGESYYRLGKNAEAIAAYQKAVGLKLTDQEAAYARYALGWAYLQTNEPAKAVEHLQQVLDKYPASPVAAESQYLLGTAQRARQDYPAAIAAFQKALAKYGDTKFAPYAQAGLAWCHFEQHAYEPALEAFKQVAAKYPQSEPAAEARLRAADCLFHLRRFAEAAPLYEQVAADKGGKWADEALYWLAVAYEQIPDDRDKATAAYARLATDFPQSPRVADSHLHVGRLQLQAGQVDEALMSYQAAAFAAKTPGAKLQAQANLAWARYRKDKSEAALAEVEKLLKQDPKSPWAAELGYQMAFAHFLAERYQPALTMLDMVVASRPEAAKQADIMYLTGACQEKLGNDAKGEELYRKVVKEAKDPEYTGLAAAALANLYARQGKLDQARKLAEELQKSEASPEAKAYALNAVGEALYKAKQYPEAIQAYDKALTLAPESGSAPYSQLGLAWAKLAAGDPKAADSFLNVARRYPKSPATQRVPEGLLALAEKQFEAGQFAEAQAGYQRLLDSFPESDLADEAQYKKAWALLKQDKSDEALADFAAAAPKASSPAVAADARYQAARLMVGKGQAQPAAALLEPFATQYAEAEVTPLALALLGRIETDRKQYDKATAAFQMVIDRHGQSPAVADAWLGLGRIQRQQKQPDKALEALGKALAGAQGPLGAEAQHELAATYRDKGDQAKAAEEFLKVAILYGDEQWSARSQYEAGLCYEALNDKDAAIKSYKIIARDYPKQQEWVDQAAARLKALE